MNTRGFTSALSWAQVGPWTCKKCLLQSRRGPRNLRQIRGYASSSKQSIRPKRRRVVLAAAGGALALSALPFGDDAKHAYNAVERTGRVVSTLAVCMNEYVNFSLETPTGFMIDLAAVIELR